MSYTPLLAERSRFTYQFTKMLQTLCPLLFLKICY